MMLRRMNVALGILCVLAASGVAKAEPIRITQPTDTVHAIYNTTAGGDATASSSEQTGITYSLVPASAIDGNLATKYLNFGNGAESESSATKGVGTGFYITPSMGKTLLTGFQFATAEDEPTRDPLSITLEGSNATDAALTLGSSWTTIYSGVSGLETTLGRSAWGIPEAVAATTGYSSYRVLITSQRGVTNCMQYSEMALYGNAVPEPSSICLGMLGLTGLLAYAWRKMK